MKKKRIILIAVAALIVIAAAVTVILLLTGGSEEEKDIPAGDSTAYSDGNWEMTKEWTISRAESGEETLRVLAAQDSTAWNTFFNLYERWSVSADFTLEKTHGASDCMRMVFGDTHGNVCLVVSVEYQGKQRVLLKADALTENGWKNVLLGEDWISVKEGALNLKVSRDNGKNSLEIALSQNDELLSEATTKTMTKQVMEIVRRPGLSVYHSEGSFSDFAVVADRKPTDAGAVTEGVIVAGDNVPTDEWLLGENAVHNLLNDKSAIILDGERENLAWNAVNTLSDVWTLSFKVEFGKSYRDSVCARFMFGPEADLEGDYCGLVTVNYANSGVNLQIENKEGSAWITTGTSLGWKPVASRSVNVEIVKYSKINRIAVFLYEGNRLVFSTFSDELSEKDMAKYRHYGVMVYSSQVRFSEFTYSQTADESKMPDMTERVYPKISNLAIGNATATGDWSLSKNTVFFRENGKDAMVIDSKGEEFSYYVKNSIAGEWSMSAKVEFGTYYSDTAGVRVAFADAGGDLSALLTAKYSPSDNTIDVNLQTYEKDKDLWTDVLKSGWAKGESSFVLKLSGDAKGNFTVRILSAASSSVIYEKTIAVPESAYKKMTVLGLGTISTQSKYSEIAMQLTGKAISIKPETDKDDKTMYALGIGTPTASSRWSAGSGITVNTEGAVIVKSQSNLYTYNQEVKISDAFSISTDVLFGSLDSRGCCTARIALVDQYQSMIGLFTIKFSENFEVMVEGQYNNNGTWYTCVYDNAWREVQDNRIHVTLSRAAGSDSYVLSIRDFGGSNVFYSTCSFPSAVSRKIAAFGLGVDQATVKFSQISAQASGDGGGSTIEDYGMLPIVKGTPATTDLWSTGEGIAYYTDGSLILSKETGDLYSYHLPTKITDGFALVADAQFGSLDKNGVCSARIVLTDKDGGKLALFTVKFSQNFEVMVEGEYNTGSAWTKCVSDNRWHKAKDNRVKITLTRADGSNDCVLVVKDFGGTVLFTETCTIAQAVARRVAGIGLGTDASIVKFSNITIDATKGEERPEKEMVPIAVTGTAAAENADWSSESGTAFYSDGSAILTAGGNDVYTYYRHAPLKSAFTFGATVQFGKLDAQGVSTARIALTDEANHMVGLFTLKFSESFEVMAEGQYTDGSNWTGVLTDNAWNAVPDNFVALTLTRAEDSRVYTLVLRDSLGNLIYQASTSELPVAINAKIANLGIGCRDTQVKLTNLKLTSEGGTPDGEEAIVPGTQTTSADWTSGNGIAHYTDGSMIIAGSGDCFSYYTKAAMQGSYAVQTDIIFGTKAADNTATARVTLASSGRDPVGLFSVKYSDAKQVLVEGQYYDGASWTTLVSSDWKDAGTNHVVLTLRAAGENKWQLTIAKTDGSVLYSTTTSALPKAVYDSAVVCGLGSYSSQVKFDKTAVTTQGGAIVGGDEDIVPGTPTAASGWHDDAGVTHYTDGSIIASASGDAYGFYTAKALTDAYTLRTDLVFGTKGDGGNATARVALGDTSYHPVGLFTLKCDASNKLLVEGQYYDGTSWTTIAASGWLESGVKRVRVTLSKAAGENKWSFTVTKSDGTALFSTTSKEIPAGVLAKCAYFGLGSYRSQVKFDKLAINIEGTAPDTDDAIVPGTPTSTADWNSTAGITHYTDGSIIANGSGDCYSFNTAHPLGDAYTLQTDLLFGTKSDNGSATARVALGSEEYHPAGLITLKCDESDKLLVEVQSYDGTSWTSLGTSGWLNAGVKRVRVTVTKAAGESQWGITVSKADGTVLYSVKTAELAASVLANAKYFGVGSYSSQVQFKNIALTV